jgi:hypothetical protein
MKYKDLELDIIRQIKKSLNEDELEISLTPIMYNPEDFRPMIGVRVKENNEWVVKYKIHITEEK